MPRYFAGYLLFGISVIAILMPRLIAGDPILAMMGTQVADATTINRLRNPLELDQPLLVQYLVWIGYALQSNIGYSYGKQRPVIELGAVAFPATLQLTAASLLLVVSFRLLLGSWAALKRNRQPDMLGIGIALALVSVPNFWLGMLLIMLFAMAFPAFDVVSGPRFGGVVVPPATQALSVIGYDTRFVRFSLLSARDNAHGVTARARGCPRHGLLATCAAQTRSCRY